MSPVTRLGYRDGCFDSKSTDKFLDGLLRVIWVFVLYLTQRPVSVPNSNTYLRSCFCLYEEETFLITLLIRFCLLICSFKDSFLFQQTFYSPFTLFTVSLTYYFPRRRVEGRCLG